MLNEIKKSLDFIDNKQQRLSPLDYPIAGNYRGSGGRSGLLEPPARAAI
jgi:hypothetical protein